jgi:hypothetical protein
VALTDSSGMFALTVAIGGNSGLDMLNARLSQDDPTVWSGRGLQEGFVDLADVRSCINVSGF